MKPIIHVGKSGITDALVEELKKQIKANHLVKVKLLKSALYDKDINEVAQQLAEVTRSDLIEIRGNSIVLYR